ncbi:signal-induced proliferation-associated 1-like protein 1 isoform X4 [Lytechinus variegatus]|uniref:signal-induced proliferation-associated 1-like protein 1 isoform X4 n=1 Tax=Lytechinus variegatus TaxID=7654 RepID=UPI001BB15A63|nr:signal-induced proliferation-associated 1-like protein 1 isoform X4 [Lytechinus variegatus]
MATASRGVHGNYAHSGAVQPELIQSARQSAQEMADYYHSKVVQNGHSSSSQQSEDNYYRPSSATQSQGNGYQSGSTVSRGVSTPRSDSRSWGRSSGDSGSGQLGLTTGQFRATPVKVDFQANEEASEVSDNEKDYHKELMSSTQDLLARQSPWLRSKEEARQYWRDEEKRTHRSPQHRRHNTSPDGKYFEQALGVVSASTESHRTLALTTDNLRKFNRGGDLPRITLTQNLRRSMSNSTLDMIEKTDFNAAAVTRDFGSTSSLDVQSTGGESFFRMLQDYKAVDERSPAPPQFKQLIQGRVTTVHDGRSNTAPLPARTPQTPQAPPKQRSTTIERSQTIPSPKQPRRYPSKREKRDRTKSYSNNERRHEGSFFRKLRKGERGDVSKENSDNRTADEMLETRIEEGVRRRAFEHFDVQSLHFELGDLTRSSDLIAKGNMTTGASAASKASSTNTPEGSVEDLLTNEEQDPGDKQSNDLLSSCPYFRNEIGDEVEPRVTLSKMGMLSTRAMRRYRHQTILEKRGASELITNDDQSNYVWRGPVIEHMDQGALYYRKYFYKHEHQNYFGVDDFLGPLAVSIRRERVEEQESPVENSKDHNMRYRYRILLRSSELTTLRGSVMEDSIPSTTKHNTNRGIPLRDVLEYIAPDLPLACLRLAPDSPKVRDQLLKIDEQGVTDHYKVGIMYCKAGQSTEEEMYNNEHASPAFDEFLECIGEKIRLKDFEKYRAQLDNKTDSTGTHSLYAMYQSKELMFHVSTMLPFTNNRQQLLRKRHIGNDIVTIVFQEPGALPFTPKNVRSQFQHVFIIVRVHEPNTENVHYSIAVSRSKEVPSFGPPLPANATFQKSKVFADFLLAKIINAENAVHKADKFIAMATRTRKEYLKDLAASYVTSTAIETGGGGKFKLFDKKKEKTCPRPAPDFKAKGALVWDVQAEDFSLSDPVDCLLAVSMDMMVLTNYHTREVLFSIPCVSVIGWTPYPHGLKLYFNEGNCVRVRIPDQDLDEVPEIVKRFEAVSNGTRTKEITLRRNGLGQLGFHVHYQGIVVEVDPYGFAWQAGLRKGARLVEICEIAVCTQTHEEMIDLLRTSQTVKVVVVPPCEDGSPRRGSTPIEYMGNSEAVTQPGGARQGFNRGTSTGKGPHKISSSLAMSSRDLRQSAHHSRSASTPGQPPSMLRSAPNTPIYPPGTTEEGLPVKGSVRSAITTFERRINVTDQPSGSTNKQHPYRAAVDYWKDVNTRAHQQANTGGGTTPQEVSSRGSGHSRGLSHDAGDRSFMRMVHERRSAREQRRRPNDMQARLRSSQEDLDRIGTGAHSRQGSLEDSLDNYRTRALNRCMSAPSGVQHPVKVYKDVPKPNWHRPNEPNPFPQERGREQDKQQPQFVTPKARYPLHNVAQATIKHTSSGDTLSTNTSDEKWYDTGDDANGYHDNGVTVSKDVPEGMYRTNPAATNAPGSQDTKEENRSNYAMAERYSPTEQLYQSRSREGIDMEQPRLQRPNHLAGIVPHHHATPSNISDHSTHSTLSGGSGTGASRDYGSLRASRQSPARSPMPGRSAQSPETVRKRAQSPRRGGSGDYVSIHRRGGAPSASSSSSMSESSTSPKMARRRPLDGHKSSNESLAARSRGNSATTPTVRSGGTTPLKAQTNNRVQDDLRKLLAPDAYNAVQERERVNGDSRHTSSITINVAGNPQIISNGHHDGPHQPHPSSSSSASYSPLPSPTSTSAPAVTMVTIPGSLQEAGSEEHIVAATSTSTTNRTPHFQICISRVPNTGNAQQNKTPILNSQSPPLNRTVSEESLPNHVGTYPRSRKQSHPTPRSEFIVTSTQSGAMPSKMQAEKTMLHGDERSASTDDLTSQGFPLPDTNNTLDWDNLVKAAKEFHVPGMEQSAFKSISIDHLDDADDAIVGAITFANNAAVDKRMSKSSDSLSGGLTQRRSRSTSLGEKDADSAYEEGPSATSARTKSELEVELRRLTHQLNMERKQKEDMQSKISQLQEERLRLQGESASAAVQLKQIKDWIYQGDKPVK